MKKKKNRILPFVFGGNPDTTEDSHISFNNICGKLHPNHISLHCATELWENKETSWEPTIKWKKVKKGQAKKWIMLRE